MLKENWRPPWVSSGSPSGPVYPREKSSVQLTKLRSFWKVPSQALATDPSCRGGVAQECNMIEFSNKWSISSEHDLQGAHMQ